MDGERAVRELLIEGLDDWIPVDGLLAYARRTGVRGDAGFRDRATALMANLLERRLAVFGGLGASGFEPWDEDPPGSLARAVRELDVFDWRPMGAAFWIANTPEGDAGARRLLDG